MSIKDGEFEFKLSTPLGFSFQGAKEETLMVTLFEPSMEHIKFYLKLKQLLTISQMDLAKASGMFDTIREGGQEVKPFQDDTENIELGVDETFQAFKASLEASVSVEMADFIGTFTKMILIPSRKPLARVDGKVPMTSTLWNNLSPDDAYNMAVRWCSFFAMPSQEGMKTTLDQQSDSHMERKEA